MDPRAENDPSFYLYVLECADGTWYTGYTVDVAERVRAHNAGAGAKYTRSRLPVRLLAPFEQVLSDLMPAAGVREDTEGVDVGGEAR